ncbi:CDP-alcohol phosphatidyltransferase family protein [Extibacter muris]|uniref:Phosphatidylserine synthase n=1 Tax=Extibacter muris TaxID=1796622 RepID=A0A4R4F8T5_9FIRM|nr:CDP-alcohol phosphatidyltransferase family protein [Extibacter muris]MCU0081155.1 CDP-alcohol phosphatidyltransferase family protein [Extibacter muris]TDA20152.1 phosphatidylserine synthase [Extibacter muris]
MEEKKKLNGYYNYTVVLTYLGMLIGFIGIIYTMEERYDQALVALMIAGICDMFDGAVAATKQRDEREKKFGIQIDSLSDLICFGVLPALIAYSITGKTYFGFLTGCLYVLCALIRLAYFNVLEEERQKVEIGSRSYYQGLPVTSVALLLPAVYEIGNKMPNTGGILLQIVMVILAVAFVLPFRVKKPYLIGKIGIVFTGIIEFVILLLGLGLEV